MEKESMFCCLQEMPLIMSFLAILLLFYVAVFLWGRPKYVEEYYFSKQGITGPPYRFLIGNLKELAAMSMEASSHPMPSSHNILPRVLPFYHQWKNIYGTTFIMWFGPTKRLAIAEPKLIREIFISKSDFFEKVDTPLLVKHLEGEGLLNLKGEKWAQHKKIITPLFHMDNLKLSMIITESLRLYPPAVATLRKAKCDIKLGPYKIPRGTELMIPILGLHHDKTIWGNDADEFIPTRFAMGVARAAKHPAGFLPFGLGIRKCTGQNLAILQVKLTLCIILQRFSFHLSPNYQHGPTVKMLLYPQYGAPIIFRRLPINS